MEFPAVLLILLSLLLEIRNVVYGANIPSPFTCLGKKYNITRENNDEASSQFQKWLFWRQNSVERCRKGAVESSTQYGFGLGASLMESIKKMIAAIELGEFGLYTKALQRFNYLNSINILRRKNLSSSNHLVVV